MDIFHRESTHTVRPLDRAYRGSKILYVHIMCIDGIGNQIGAHTCKSFGWNIIYKYVNMMMIHPRCHAAATRDYFADFQHAIFI